ncbi:MULTISPECIES: hypothetical protein [unclassified Staphylococcus]|uniref:hypothetical protein n=1 Tax=Mammaliicoccus sciuri TaxID=1296 RepID=UPI00194FE60A
MKFLKDILTNIVAQSFLLAIQQLILFPHYESILGTKDFGVFLTLFGLINTISIGLGTAFTNLYQRKYNLALDNNSEMSEFKTYFYKLIKYFILLSLFIYIIFRTITSDLTLILLVMVLTLLITVRLFLIVKYRVQKKFNAILLFNVILGSFYSILVFIGSNNLNLIIMSIVLVEIISIIILMIFTNIFSYKLKKVSLFDGRMLTILLISGFAGATMNYSDRLLIVYLLSSNAVSVFYIATLPSKMLLVPFNMLSSVILSYLADTKFINKKLKKIVTFIIPILCFVIFTISYFFGIVLIKLIYPSYLDDIKSIYLIVNMTFSLTIFDFIIRSFLVKYFSLSIKAIIDVMSLCMFIIFSVIAFNFYESLSSIALAQLFTLIIKVVIEYIIFIKLKEEK